MILAAAFAVNGKPVKVSLAEKPRPATALAAWSIKVRVSGNTRFSLSARSGPTVRAFRVRKLSRRVYRARLVFPFGGRWSLSARVGRRRFALGAVAVRAAPPVRSALPGATAFRICRAAGSPYPQYALTLGLGSLWVACRTNYTILRVDAETGETRGLLDVPVADVYTLAAGEGALWAAQRTRSIVRVDPASGRARTAYSVRTTSPYVFTAGGSVWFADDDVHELIRLNPATGAATRLSVGDGTSSVVVVGGRAWITNHRDATLERVELSSNTVTPLGRLPGDAPERMIYASGSLWITGRGTDLLRVDPETGAVQAVIEIGAGGIGVQAAGGSIWVFAAGAEDDGAGLPILDRLLRVDPATNRIVGGTTPTGRVAVNGTASDGARLWIADTVAGRLYRVTA